MSEPAATLYALLIGVSAYHPAGGVASLRGSANDVAEMQRLLVEKFGVQTGNIVTLVDAQATHAAIKQAIQTHLIDRADGWLATPTKNPPAFLFYFSGHGSQARDLTGQEPDGMDETIVPYDSRTPGVYDIRDWELGQMVESLSAATNNITVILDCCHSGSGTRRVDQSPVRSCPADLRPQPFYRPFESGQRAISSAGWELGRKHALIAGCRDRELANEMAILDGEREIWRGALSYFLQQEVQKMNVDAPLTCRELVERVRAQVTQRFSSQTPQCEGDVDREFLGGLRPVRDRFFTVVEESAGLFWLDAGIAQGVRTGAIFSVYAPHTRTLADAGEPLARLQVVEERISRSGCRRIGGDEISLLWGRATMVAAGTGSLVRTVHLDISDASLKESLLHRLAPLPKGDVRVDVSPFVRVVESHAELTVTLRDGQLALLASTGALSPVPAAVGDVESIALALAHVARFLNAMDLKNDAPNSGLAGMATLALQRLVVDAQAQRATSTPIAPQPGGEIVVESGERIVLEMRNRAGQPLHIGLFGFGADFEVFKLFPRGAGSQEALPAGRAHWFGRSLRRGEQLEVFLPPGVNETRDVYKLIASVEEINFDLLVQGPLGSPITAPKPVMGVAGQAPSALDLLFAQTAGLIGSKDALPPAADAWTTAELVVHAFALLADVTQALVGGQVTQSAAFPLSFAPPSGCDGQVRVLTQRQVHYFTGDARALQPPPGLAAFPEFFQPQGIGPVGASQGALIEFVLNEAARRCISPETPLLLELGWALAADTAGVIALAWDGATFFPVGRAVGPARILALEWLPQPDSAGGIEMPGGSKGAPVVRVFLYRLITARLPDRGLHTVRLLPVGTGPDRENVEIRLAAGRQLAYESVQATAFQAHQRIALVAPDFGAESSELAGWLLSEGAPTYDHVLAFDDETTGVIENAIRLLDALRALRLDKTPGLRVDLFAQGMGALLARSLSELLRADAFIRRCFLIGPPNQGTPLAASTLWLPWLLSLELNQAGSTPPWLAVRWALGELSTSTGGPEELRPQSEFLQRLGRVRRRLTASYFVLAGDASSSPANLDLAQRLARQLTHAGVGLADVAAVARGDLVAPLESMITMGNHVVRSAVADTFIAPCNHLAYLDDPQAQGKLATWIAASL